MCLISGIEIAYRRLFRIAGVAFGALLFGSLLQVLWITLQPAEAVTRASLGIVPDSVAAWFAPTTEVPPLVYLLLGRAGGRELQIEHKNCKTRCRTEEVGLDTQCDVAQEIAYIRDGYGASRPIE